jgi:hypothetical protein
VKHGFGLLHKITSLFFKKVCRNKDESMSFLLEGRSDVDKQNAMKTTLKSRQERSTVLQERSRGG